jgi:glucosamine kinase
MNPDPTARIGIDGGGTSCRAALMLRGHRFDAVGGPANVNTDFSGAVAVMDGLLADVAAQAGLPRDDLHRVPGHFGLAGVMSPGMGRAVADALYQQRTVVTDDHPTTIVGALGDADGAVAAIGTGSFLGRQNRAQTHSIGGWGYRIGDQASGAWLGRRLLEQVLLVQDGIAPRGPLVDRAMAHDFGDGGIIGFSFRASPADYAQFAPAIVVSDDPFAITLMQEGAAYMLAGIRALGWQGGDVLCLAGGLGPAYARHLGVPVTPAKGTALDGALNLAGRI